MRYLILCHILCLILYPCLGNEALFSKVKDFDEYEDDEDEMAEQINNVFAYVMPKFRCCHLFHDDSLFSNYILHTIFEIDQAPSIILGIKERTECHGFVVVTSLVQHVPKIIEKLPKWADHRILVISKVKSQFFFHKLLDSQAPLFGDAESFVYTTNNFDTGHRLSQPIREFEHIDNLTIPWEVDDNGCGDYQGRKMKVMTANCSMFSWFKWPIQDAQNSSHFDGIEMKVVRLLSERLNITLDYQIPPNIGTELPLFTRKKWYKDPIKKSEVDMAFCGLMISLNKYNFEIPMSDPLYKMCFKFVIPRPKPLRSEWYGIFLPFSIGVWVSMAGILGITSFLLQRISMKSIIYAGSRVKKYESLGGSMLQLMSILVLSSVPLSTSCQGATRHILTWWSLFTVLLTTSFSSSLVSHLTNQRYSSQATEIREYIKRGWNWVYLETPDFNEILDLDHDVWQQRWRYRSYRVKSEKDLFEKLKNKKHVLYGVTIQGGFGFPNDVIFYNYTSLENFETASSCFVEYSNGFAFRTGSPFERSFNALIEGYKEYGILYKIAWRVQTERAEKHPFTRELLVRTKPGIAPPRGLMIEDVLGIIEVWAGGLGLAVIVFFLEVLQRFHI